MLCTSCCVPRSVRARLLESRKADRAPGEFDSESYGGDVLAGGVLHLWVRHEPEYFRIAASIENNRKQLRNFRGRVRMPTRGGYGKKRLDTSVEAADRSVCATTKCRYSRGSQDWLPLDRPIFRHFCA